MLRRRAARPATRHNTVVSRDLSIWPNAASADRMNDRINISDVNLMTHPPSITATICSSTGCCPCRSPESAKHGTPVHDEMLFIIVHQAYELWFKQVLHEFDRIERDFSTNPVDDEAMARIVHSLARVHEILKLLVAQLDVLETMTPADFLDFRDYLFPASGFQSLQFRLIETRLGLARGRRASSSTARRSRQRLSATDRQKLAAARVRPTVLALLDTWLARTPFLDWGGESFRWAYRAAVVRHLSADVETVKADAAIPAERREREITGLDKALEAFAAIFEPDRERDDWRLSPKADPGGSLHHRLPRNAGGAAALPPALAAHGHRRDPHILALPSCPDGGAHDRTQDRHRRLVGTRLSPKHGRTAPHFRRSVPAFDLPHPAFFAAGIAAPT